MKKLLSLLLAISLLICAIAVLSSCNKESDVDDGNTNELPEYCEYLFTRNNEGKDMKYVKLTIKDYGPIVLALDATVAPVSVNNFVKLVEEGFYDGLTFHRVVEGFVIQGGDPNKDGSGGSPVTIYGEFKENGYTKNDISHIRGVISMARASYSNNSASSQFFICLDNVSSSLDNKYASFGYVIYGMSTVDKILKHGLANIASGETVIADKQTVIEKAEVITEEQALEYTKGYVAPEK